MLSDNEREIDDIRRKLAALSKQLDHLARREVPPTPSSLVTYAGTPTAGRLAQFTGAGTIEQTAYAGSVVAHYAGVPVAGRAASFLGPGTVQDAGYPGSAVTRYSGVPVAGNYAYWTANGTVADSGFGTSQLPRYSGAPSAGQLAIWSAAGTVFGTATFGTADLMLLSGAQTVGGVKTFSDGISFGNETLEDYDPNTWSPVITGSSSNPTISYTTQSGRYTRVGDFAVFSLLIVINTISGGSGTCRVSLPLTVVGINTVAGVVISGPDATGSPFAIVAETESGQAYVNIRLINDNAGIANLAVTDLAAGDLIRVSGIYFVA